MVLCAPSVVPSLRPQAVLGCNKVFDTVRSTIGEIHILVNNAAFLPARRPYSDCQPDWWLGFEINVKGSFNLTTAFMRGAGPGSILINISSIVAHWRTVEGYIDGQSSYSASKVAMTRAMEILQKERPEIRVVNVHPGLVATGMAAKSGTTDLSIDSGMSKYEIFIGDSFVKLTPHSEFTCSFHRLGYRSPS